MRDACVSPPTGPKPGLSAVLHIFMVTTVGSSADGVVESLVSRVLPAKEVIVCSFNPRMYKPDRAALTVFQTDGV